MSKLLKRKNILTKEMVAKRPKILADVRLSDAPVTKNELWVNRERVLFIKSRGLSHKGQELMTNLLRLCPHAKKDSTLDDKNNLSIINEIAEMKNCTKILHFEARRNNDLYMWMSNVNDGPSVKFLVKDYEISQNYKFTGNVLVASRPLLSFSADFENRVELKFVKEMLTQIFGVPNHHPKSQPFIDRIYNFSVIKGQIVFRHYQIVDHKTQDLVEVGPRILLEPIKIFNGSLCGKVLFANEEFVTPNQVRALIREKNVLDKIKPLKLHKHKKALPNTLVEDETDQVFMS